MDPPPPPPPLGPAAPPLAASASPPPTPTTSAFAQANATVLELAASLSTVTRRVSGGGSGSTPPGAGAGAEGWEDERRALEREVVMVAQIGQALLERQEAYRLKAEKELDGLRQHKEKANKILIEANDQLQASRQTNEGLVAQLALSTRENGALERRLLQALTSLTLSDSSIATLRAELAALRSALSKQAGAQARSTGWEDKVRAAERQRDEGKDELAAERRKRVESERRGHKAHERISDLEVKLNAARRELDAVSKTKEELVQDVALQVKTRMQVMHDELNAGGSPNPEVQQVLEGLMAENVTLKGDNGELRELLNEYRQTHARSPHTAHFDQSAGGFSAYSDAEDGPGGGNNISRSSTAFFSDELAASTASRPHADRTQSADGPSRYAHGRQDSWAPSVRSSFAAHRHGRTDSWTPSLAPSFASSSSYGGGGGGGGGPGSAGMLSPTAGLEEESDGAGLGFGGSGFPPGGKKGVYSLSGSARRFKDRSASASSSAGPTAWQRGHVKRSFSLDRPRGVQRAFSGVGSIAERSATDDEDTASGMETADVDAFSPSSLDADRNLAAYETGRRSSAPPGPDGPHASSSHDPQVPLSLDDLNVPQISPEKKKIRRRPMLLLSKTKGVQTDPVDFGTSTDGLGFSPPPTHLHHHHQARPSISPSISTTSDLDPRHSASLVSSSPSLPSYNSAAGASSDAGGGGGPHDPRSMALTSLIEYMTRLLAKVSQSDVQTLTKRLKRQHLPGDVGHLAKSTLASIVAEVDDLRDHFRAVLEAERKQDWSALHSAVEKEKLGSLVTRKDFLSLVKLFKEIFAELSSLRLTVNEIVLDPSSAVKLRERVLAAEEDEATRPPLKPTRNSSGLGWISAPISKFFITPPVETSEDDSSTIGSGKLSLGGASSSTAGASDRGRLHPSRAAPKLAAATASTTTTVNVEFASGGAVRRATATTSMAGTGTDAERPNSPSSRPPSSQGLAPPPDPTVRAPSPSRPSAANRANLRGIFAGASSGASPAPSSWLLAGGSGAPAGRLRHAASSSVLRSTPAPPAANTGSPVKKHMSSAVDAVLDPSTTSTIGANIYERRLRRTASDESIRSHYLEPAAGAGPTLTTAPLGLGAPPARKPPAARTVSGGSMFANLSSRLLAFAGDTTGALLADDPSDSFAAASPPGSASLAPSSLARPGFLSAVGSNWDDTRNGRPV